MGSNAIIAIVVGAIVVIVGFSLWPVLNGASNQLYSYFRNSCDDGSGNRFLRAYVSVTTVVSDDTATVAVDITPDSQRYDPATGIHGGKGVAIVDDGGNCKANDLLTVELIERGGSRAAGTFDADGLVYNEQGNQIGSIVDNRSHGATDTGIEVDFDAPDPPYSFVKVAPILARFSGINNLLLTILPVISIAGFLGVSGAKLYTYGKGASDIGSAISTSIFTLIAIVVAMVIAGPIMGSLVEANQVVESGQYQVNNSFGNIISLLFSMIPIIYVAGLVTLVGLQAKAALMGGKGGGGM